MFNLARQAGVSHHYAKKVVEELTMTGCLHNPSVTKLQKNVTCGISIDFTLEEEVFTFF
jgi:hypothetical protein